MRKGKPNNPTPQRSLRSCLLTRARHFGNSSVRSDKKLIGLLLNTVQEMQPRGGETSRAGVPGYALRELRGLLMDMMERVKQNDRELQEAMTGEDNKREQKK